jgi:hypothetical protein
MALTGDTLRGACPTGATRIARERRVFYLCVSYG